MQAISKIKSGVKNSFVTALELIGVRLEMAKLELNEQKESLLLIILLALTCFLFLLFAGLSLLFALNTWLPENDKFSVFMFIGVGCMILILIFALIILRLIRRQRGFLDTTIRELKLDIAAIKQSVHSQQNQ
jgi:uncharacterized membrane protein YqjE